jgi:predicted nucleic acid-binding protein
MNSALAKARKIYVDSNVVIYFIEGETGHQDKANALFEFAVTENIPLMTSEITFGECLYGAYKRERIESVTQFESLFHEVGLFNFIPAAIEIIKRAAKIGADQRLKLIDAIHFASALDVGCDVFVTNDRGIKSTSDLTVVQLPDL